MNRKYTYVLIVIFVTAILFFAEKYVDQENEHYPEENATSKTDTSSEFHGSYLPESTTGVVVNHNYFTLSYSETHEQAEWVAYELKKSHLSKNDFERPYFIQDREVSSGSADWRNYKNSGYDRGHLVPAGDRRFEYNAYHETFLTSNISPQDREFNGGIWNRLEQKVRYWAGRYDGVYVVTGGILKQGLGSIGDEDVSVPLEFYKIILDISNGKKKAIAFIIPNEKSEKSIYEYMVTIDQVETKTGIDFFPDLPDSEEKRIEATLNIEAWGGR